ncbi:MAG: glycosyltransferase, partial [Actinobacteria bacterium]|nr:glycosyltransferase [Actinomycetota bacterium]
MEEADGPTRTPLATVLVPAKNEERWISRCLDHLAGQDLDLARLEVIVVDGGSTDATVEVVRAHPASRRFGRFVVVAGEGDGTTPSNLNVGLRHAEGRFVCRVDARSLVPPAYVRVCTEVLAGDQTVAVVGGRQVAEKTDGASGRGFQVSFDLGMNERTGKVNQTSAIDVQGKTVYAGFCGVCDIITQGNNDPASFQNGLATNVQDGCTPAAGTDACWQILKAEGL